MRRTWANDMQGTIYKLGIVVDLTVSMWGARTMLHPEDLGFDSVPELVSLGHKKLMKKEHLARIESVRVKAEIYLLQHSFSFPFGNVRFVPATLTGEVIEKMNEFKSEFDDAVEELLLNYDGYRSEMLQEWDIVFKELSFETIRLLLPNASLDTPKSEELMRTLASKYPTTDRLRGKFGFDFSVFQITPPSISNEADLSSVYTKKISDRLDGFLDDVVARLQGMVIETTQNIKERVEKGNLGGGTIKSFVKFADNFRKMDFVGLDIETELVTLRDKLLGAEKEQFKTRDFTDELQRNLGEIQAKVLDADVIRGRFKRNIERPDEEAV